MHLQFVLPTGPHGVQVVCRDEIRKFLDWAFALIRCKKCFRRHARHGKELRKSEVSTIATSGARPEDIEEQ